MRKLLKNLFIINIYFFAGCIVLDTYGKICETHKAIKKLNDMIAE